MDAKALKRKNCVPVTWDGSKKKPVPFLHYKVMVVSSICLFAAGCLVFADSILTFYYMSNPNIYTRFLLDYYNIEDEMMVYYEKDEIIKIIEANSEIKELVSKPEKFMDSLAKEDLQYIDFYYYVYYNMEKSTQKINRFFINSLIFALFEIIAAIFAFQIRQPEYDWDKDMSRLVYVRNIFRKIFFKII
jgi:hypothetical protein